MSEKQDVNMVYVRSAHFPRPRGYERDNEQTEVEFARLVNVATCKRRLYLPTQSSFERLSQLICDGTLSSFSAYFSPEHICVSYENPVSQQYRDVLIEQLGKEASDERI